MTTCVSLYHEAGKLDGKILITIVPNFANQYWCGAQLSVLKITIQFQPLFSYFRCFNSFADIAFTFVWLVGSRCNSDELDIHKIKSKNRISKHCFIVNQTSIWRKMSKSTSMQCLKSRSWMLGCFAQYWKRLNSNSNLLIKCGYA